MAKGTGNYGGYQYRPIEQDFGDDLLQHEQIGFQQRAEQREVDAIKLKADEKLRERAVKAKKALRPQHTGLKNEDQKRGELALHASDVLNEAIAKLEKNPNDVEASLIVSNLEDFPERFSQMTSRYSEWMKNGMEGMSNGQYSPYLNKDNLDKVEKVIAGQVQYGLDAKGNITGSYDKDGDGEPDFSWDGMATGVDLPEYKQRFDSDTFMDITKKRYGMTHTKNPDGTYTDVEVKELSPESRQSIKQDIEDTFGATKDSITDEGLSYIADELGLNPEAMTEEQFRGVKNQYYLNNVAQFDSKRFTEFDRAAQDRDQSRWQAAQAEKNKPKSKEQEDADWLRTLVDGTIKGDGKAVGTWIGRVIGKDEDKKDLQVTDAEFTGDRLVLDLSDGTSKTIDLSKKEAIGQLSSMANLKKEPQELMKDYETGNLMRELESGEENKYSRIQIRKALKGGGNDVTDMLNENGFNAENGYYLLGNSKKIEIKHKGQKLKFDLSTEKGKKKLEDFVIEEGKVNSNSSKLDELPDL